VAKRKAAALMYEKISMSEKNSTGNKYKDNGVFNNSCVVTSAGFDETLSMATAIDSIGHKTIEANQVQSAGLNNESTENSQRKINYVSITRTTPIDRDVNLIDNANSTSNKGNICKVTNTLTGNIELNAVQIQDQIDENVNNTKNNYKYKKKKNRIIINRKNV
jgi:hypothetical protein